MAVCVCSAVFSPPNWLFYVIQPDFSRKTEIHFLSNVSSRFLERCYMAGVLCTRDNNDKENVVLASQNLQLHLLENSDELGPSSPKIKTSRLDWFNWDVLSPFNKLLALASSLFKLLWNPHPQLTLNYFPFYKVLSIWVSGYFQINFPNIFELLLMQDWQVNHFFFISGHLFKIF